MVRRSHNDDDESAQTRPIKAVKHPRNYKDIQKTRKTAQTESYQRKKDKTKEKTKGKAKSKGKQTRDSTSAGKKPAVVRRNNMQVLVDKTMVSKEKEKSKTSRKKRKRVVTSSDSEGSKSNDQTRQPSRKKSDADVIRELQEALREKDAKIQAFEVTIC